MIAGVASRLLAARRFNPGELWLASELNATVVSICRASGAGEAADAARVACPAGGVDGPPTPTGILAREISRPPQPLSATVAPPQTAVRLKIAASEIRLKLQLQPRMTVTMTSRKSRLQPGLKSRGVIQTDDVSQISDAARKRCCWMPTALATGMQTAEAAVLVGSESRGARLISWPRRSPRLSPFDEWHPLADGSCGAVWWTRTLRRWANIIRQFTQTTDEEVLRC